MTSTAPQTGPDVSATPARPTTNGLLTARARPGRDAGRQTARLERLDLPPRVLGVARVPAAPPVPPPAPALAWTAAVPAPVAVVHAPEASPDPWPILPQRATPPAPSSDLRLEAALARAARLIREQAAV